MRLQVQDFGHSAESNLDFFTILNSPQMNTGIKKETNRRI
jgi:hypothetical protein